MKHWYKVYFRGHTPVLVFARDDQDAALRLCYEQGLDIKLFTMAIRLDSIKWDAWSFMRD